MEPQAMVQVTRPQSPHAALVIPTETAPNGSPRNPLKPDDSLNRQKPEETLGMSPGSGSF